MEFKEAGDDPRKPPGPPEFGWGPEQYPWAKAIFVGVGVFLLVALLTIWILWEGLRT